MHEFVYFRRTNLNNPNHNSDANPTIQNATLSLYPQPKLTLKLKLKLKPKLEPKR